jgi:sterol desaturase/sphingolipid hydroxylase (fatty acid hydroxylase superfamily)
MFLEVFKGFIILFLVFVPLEKLFSLNHQKIFRHAWHTDAIYYFTGYFVGKVGAVVCAFVALLFTGNFVDLELQSRVAAQPGWLQFLEAILIADFGYYTAHRLLHTVPWLWKFHVVHHSIEEMDWLAAVRVHPFEQLLAKLLQWMPLYWLGFSTETLGLYALFSAAIAFYIHANVRLNIGFLKWVIATPEFHHWHHANEPGVRNKNLAAQLPLMDYLFGTLYMPAGKRPKKLGTRYPVPTGYFQQLIRPFQEFNIHPRRKAT